MMYEVNLWASHPDAGNDDCCTGWDFDDKDAARSRFLSDDFPDYCRNPAFIELIGEGIREIRRNRKHRAVASDDSDWRREMRMQAAMGLGVQGWNDFEGQ